MRRLVWWKFRDVRVEELEWCCAVMCTVFFIIIRQVHLTLLNRNAAEYNNIPIFVRCIQCYHHRIIIYSWNFGTISYETVSILSGTGSKYTLVDTVLLWYRCGTCSRDTKAYYPNHCRMVEYHSAVVVTYGTW